MAAMTAARRALSHPARLPEGTVPKGSKGRILETALRLFIELGFHGASIRDFAREVKLQPTALYAHFASKEHVLAQLVRIGYEAHHDLLQAEILEAGSDPVDQIRSWVRAHVRFHAEYPMLAILVHEQMHLVSADLLAAAMLLRRQSERLLLDVIGRGVAQGRFHIPHVFVTASAIGGMGIRVAHWYQADFELSPIEVGNVHAELALRMLGVVAQPPSSA
jgi:AcrR family transcriptional regulator